MAKDIKYRKINELVMALTESERLLSNGALGLEGLETACANARELYERIVVLRHKARESALHGTPAAAPIPPAVVAVPIVPEVKPMRLDTRPPEVSERQTSLIDAIQETEQSVAKAPVKPAPTEKPKKDDSAKKVERVATLAEKMQQAATADLSKIITLSHKFWFVSELFNGDRIQYEKSIEKLNNFEDLATAETFVTEEVVAKLKKPADAEALSTFKDLIKRRYT